MSIKMEEVDSSPYVTRDCLLEAIEKGDFNINSANNTCQRCLAAACAGTSCGSCDLWLPPPLETDRTC